MWIALLLVVCPLCSQFETKLSPETTAAFDAYVKAAEIQIDAHPQSISNDPKLLKGQLVIHPAAQPNPRDIPDGLIHDWVGAIFYPNTSVEKVLAALQDFDHHAGLYPEIIRSRLIERRANNIVGYWRIERKQQFVPAMFDLKQDARYVEIAPGKWICHAHSIEIREVQDAGSAKEKDYPIGEGLGLLWRLNAYWYIEARGNGVLAECRTISLSRAIPGGMGWMIKPFIQNVPRESLTSTLQNTRKALY